MISQAISKRVEEVKKLAESENETLQDLMNQEDYFTYVRILDDKSYDVYSNSIVFEKVKDQIIEGKTDSIWDLNQDGTVNIIDLMTSSSNMGRINYDLDFAKIIIKAKYSSHWEFEYDGDLTIKGTNIVRQNVTGFMQKTQFDETESQATDFNTISFLILSSEEDDEGNKDWFQELYHSVNIT